MLIKNFEEVVSVNIVPKEKVYVTREIPERGLRVLLEHFDVEVWSKLEPPPKELLVKKVGDIDALVSLLSDSVDAEIFDAASALKIVAQLAVGFDNVDVQEATRRGIYVTNTPGVLTETSADFAWALLMAVARRVVEADRFVRSGKWKVSWHPKMLLGRDIYGATIGIIGAGRIGSAVARRAIGFNMKILYHSLSPKHLLEKELCVKRVDLDVLLKESDFVSVHVPLTPKTYHMMDETKLRLMKKTAFLINNSRGAVIDEKALYQALKEGWIAGAGLDVFEEEPTSNENPLLNLDNVVVAPHISSGSYETRSRMAEIVAENLVAFFDRRTPPNLVNPAVLNVQNRR